LDLVRFFEIEKWTCGARQGRTGVCMASSLHYAALHGHAAATQSLLEAGASVDAVDKHGLTPLRLAAYEGHADVARALIEAGACVDGV